MLLLMTHLPRAGLPPGFPTEKMSIVKVDYALHVKVSGGVQHSMNSRETLIGVT